MACFSLVVTLRSYLSLTPICRGHILAAEVGVGRQPVGGGRRSLHRCSPRRRRPAGCTCRCRTCTVWRCPNREHPTARRSPTPPHARSGRRCWSADHARNRSSCRGIQVMQHAGLHLAAAGSRKGHVLQIAGQYLVAHIAAVAIVVGLAISEQVAVIAILALRIIHAKRLQHVRRWARGHVLAGQLPHLGADLRQHHADHDTHHDGDDQQDQHALERIGHVEAFVHVSGGITGELGLLAARRAAIGASGHSVSTVAYGRYLAGGGAG